MKSDFIFIFVAALPAVWSSGIRLDRQREARARYLMGTLCRVSVEGAQAATAAEEALDEVARVEALISTWRSDSELARLNSASLARPTMVSPELFDLLGTSLAWAQRTDGAFDPLVGALVGAWQLRGAGRVPDRQELASAVARSRPDGGSLAADTHAIARHRHAPLGHGRHRHGE